MKKAEGYVSISGGRKSENGNVSFIFNLSSCRLGRIKLVLTIKNETLFHFHRLRYLSI